MTEEENIAFFNIVKGKKIKWSSWAHGRLFIPKERANATMSGIEDRCGNSRYSICEGLNPYIDGNYWILLPDFEAELEKL